jgi:hypothetical protein
MASTLRTAAGPRKRNLSFDAGRTLSEGTIPEKDTGRRGECHDGLLFPPEQLVVACLDETGGKLFKKTSKKFSSRQSAKKPLAFLGGGL